jgi:RNA-directed DNA polymerase
MALDGLQRLLAERFRMTWNREEKRNDNPKVNFVRYADDFVVTGNSKEVLENEVRPVIEAFLNERGLWLSPEKTRVTHIDEGFDFLGQNLRRFGGTLFIRPSRKNTQAFMSKIRTIIHQNRGTKTDDLIRCLNPVIRGWANYHRHTSATRAFKKVDTGIWRTLWQWAKGRHHNKGSCWIAEKYWHPGEGRGWNFAADTGEKTEDGKPIRIKLIKAADTPIRRHPKIKSDANPFDPQWHDYLEERVLIKRYGPDFMEKYDFLLRRSKTDNSVVKTGSASAGLWTA